MGFQKQIHSWFVYFLVDEKVDMLGHIDERDESKQMTFPCLINATREFSTPVVVGEELDSSIARERQFVQIAGVVEMLDRLSVSCHGGQHTSAERGTQWRPETPFEHWWLRHNWFKAD